MRSYLNIEEFKSNNYCRLLSLNISLFVSPPFVSFAPSTMRNLTIFLILLMETNCIFSIVTTREKVTERWKVDF